LSKISWFLHASCQPEPPWTKVFFAFCVTKLGYAVAVDRNPRFCRLITNRRDILAEYAESAPGPTYDSVLRANFVTVR